MPVTPLRLTRESAELGQDARKGIGVVLERQGHCSLLTMSQHVMKCGPCKAAIDPNTCDFTAVRGNYLYMRSQPFTYVLQQHLRIICTSS